jgi:hypothetical protein
MACTNVCILTKYGISKDLLLSTKVFETYFIKVCLDRTKNSLRIEELKITNDSEK